MWCDSRSISDDDLCSDCSWCRYNPGEESTCDKDWPGVLNDDGYCVECERFDQISEAFQNWVPEAVIQMAYNTLTRKTGLPYLVPDTVRVFEEHEQIWLAGDADTSDAEECIFSVMEAEGPGSAFGWAFEQVK